MVVQFDALGPRKFFPATKMIIKKKSKADHPCRTQPFDMGQNKAQRPDDVRGGTQKNFAFDQRFADKAEFIMLKIAQATMDQLRACRRRRTGKVIFFTQIDLKPPARCVARNAGTIDAAADNGDVICV